MERDAVDQQREKAKKPAITKRVHAKTDWPRAMRLRAQGKTNREIATMLGVPYSTIQVGLLQRVGRTRRVKGSPVRK